MKVLSWMLCLCAIASLQTLCACEQTASAKVPVEKLPDVKPSLPPVPTIPPPPFPVQYPDQSYSVYGLRRAIRRTISTELNVTAYIAKVYTPPECPPKEKCPLPPAPHLWLADTKTETDPTKLLLVGGFAENQKALDDALKDLKKHKKPAAPPEDTGILPVPTDLFLGAKVKMKGRFSYMSGAGFQSSEGVLDWGGHETLEPGVAPPPPPATAKRR
ncbi:MAG: hypothetical protein RL701_6577 [Pseudomonadota bacterium]|jgi:hypothetical protein